MKAHVLLKLLNESMNRDEMSSLPSISSLFTASFINTGAGMLDS